jgi:hypothetical protein
VFVEVGDDVALTGTATGVGHDGGDAAEDEVVGARAAGHVVHAIGADQHVIAGAAKQGVVAARAVERIVALAADQNVRAEQTGEIVVSAKPMMRSAASVQVRVSSPGVPRITAIFSSLRPARETMPRYYCPGYARPRECSEQEAAGLTA